MLGSNRVAVPGVPKRSLLERYFRVAAIDGMTDPFFLEIIVNPDTLPFERPFVVAHEWAHLAGYANEAEANFVAWLACTQGDAMARYSGWLAVFEHVVASVQRPDRTTLTSQLAAGPRRDLQAAAARYARASPVVRTAARDVVRHVFARESRPRGRGELHGRGALDARRGTGEWRQPAAAVGLSPRSDGIEIVELCRRHRRCSVAGAQIVGADLGGVAVERFQDLDVGPRAPSALMTTMGLLRGQSFTDALVGVPQAGRVDAWRAAGDALHC